MTERRRRHCKGCGKWLSYGDGELCRACDPECYGCSDRQSACDEPFVAGECRPCIEANADEPSDPIDRQRYGEG